MLASILFQKKTMKKKVFIIVFLLSSIKCKQGFTNEVVTLGYIVTIQFDIQNIRKLEENHFFLIDKTKFIHKSNFTNNYIKNTLPTFKPSLFKVEDKILKEEINIINLGLILIKNLKKTEEYELINIPQTYVNGIITLKRKDNKKIKIIKNRSYPLIIKTLQRAY